MICPAGELFGDINKKAEEGIGRHMMARNNRGSFAGAKVNVALIEEKLDFLQKSCIILFMLRRNLEG